MNNQRGSALLESLLAMLNIGCVATVIGTALYISFAKVWIHFSLYEGIYCLIEQKQKVICELKTRKRINRIVPLPAYTSIRLSKSLNRFSGKLQLGKIDDQSWKNKLNRRIFEYDISIENPALKYRRVQ